MAFKKPFLSQIPGDDPFDAYWRVEETRILNKNSMMVCIRAYRSENDVYHIDERCFDSVPFNVSGGNPWEQAYVYLKRIPEFAGAVDC